MTTPSPCYWQLHQAQARPRNLRHALLLLVAARWQYVQHQGRWYKYKRRGGHVYWLQKVRPKGWRVV